MKAGWRAGRAAPGGVRGWCRLPAAGNKAPAAGWRPAHLVAVAADCAAGGKRGSPAGGAAHAAERGPHPKAAAARGRTRAACGASYRAASSVAHTAGRCAAEQLLARRHDRRLRQQLRAPAAALTPAAARASHADSGCWGCCGGPWSCSMAGSEAGNSVRAVCAQPSHQLITSSRQAALPAAHPAGSRHYRRRRAAPRQAPCSRQPLGLRSPQGSGLLLAQLQRLQAVHSRGLQELLGCSRVRCRALQHAQRAGGLSQGAAMSRTALREWAARALAGWRAHGLRERSRRSVGADRHTGSRLARPAQGCAPQDRARA